MSIAEIAGMVGACKPWHDANGMRLMAILIDPAQAAGKFKREDRCYEEGEKRFGNSAQGFFKGKHSRRRCDRA
jgi:hypothetical protein